MRVLQIRVNLRWIFFAESKIIFLFVNGVALLIKLLDRNILQNSGKFRNVWGNGQKLPKVPR